MRCNTEFFNLDKCLKSIGGIKNMWVSPSLPLKYLKDNFNGKEFIYFLGASLQYTKLNIKDDSVSLTTEISVNDEVGNTSYTTNINIKQADLLANDLQKYANAELSVIFQDIQDRYYIVGYDNLCKLTTGTATSGTQLGDFNGVELTLTTSDKPVLLVTSYQQADDIGINYYVAFNDNESIIQMMSYQITEENIDTESIKIQGASAYTETIDDKVVITIEYSDSLGLNEDLMLCSWDLSFYSQEALGCYIDKEVPQIQQVINYFEEKADEEKVFLKTISKKLLTSPSIFDVGGNIESITYPKGGLKIVNQDDISFFGIRLVDIMMTRINSAILDVTVNSGINITNSNHILKFTINNLYLGYI